MAVAALARAAALLSLLLAACCAGDAGRGRYAYVTMLYGDDLGVVSSNLLATRVRPPSPSAPRRSPGFGLNTHAPCAAVRFC